MNLSFTKNQPLKSVNSWNIGIFEKSDKNSGSFELIKKNKNFRLCDLNWGSESRNMCLHTLNTHTLTHIHVEVKVKFTLEHATYVQRGSRGKAVLLL